MTYRSKVATVYLLSLFLDLINMFISGVALPAMSADLHASVAQLAWVSNGYIIGLTLVVPLSRWLTHRFGARRLFLLSLSLFALATLAVSHAQSLTSLVSWRVIQGAGGGLLIPVGQALTWQLYAPAERTRISTLVMMVALLAPATSPALGGVLVEHSGWHAVFLVSLPMAIIALVCAFIWLRDAPTSSPSSALDALSVLTSAGGLLCLLLSLTALSEPDKMIAGLFWLLPALLLLAAFISRSRRHPAPLLALHLVHMPLLRFSMLVYLCTPGFFIGVNMIAVFWLQQMAGLSAAANGALMLAWSVAAFIAIHTSGRWFNRVGPKPMIICGCLCQAAGILWLIDVNSSTLHLVLYCAYALMGFGGSLCSSSAQNSAMLEIDAAEMADASALWNINRQLSFCLGVALLSLLLNVLEQQLPQTQAYTLCFIVAAGVTLLPALVSLRLNSQAIKLHLLTEERQK